jgi:hypothetical protein
VKRAREDSACFAATVVIATTAAVAAVIAMTVAATAIIIATITSGCTGAECALHNKATKEKQDLFEQARAARFQLART